jgi:hypothetical protein
MRQALATKHSTWLTGSLRYGAYNDVHKSSKMRQKCSNALFIMAPNCLLLFLTVFLSANTFGLGLADDQLPTDFAANVQAGQGSMTGHLEPLGKQREPLGDVKTVSMFPDPPGFYADNAKPSVPVLFKGAASHFPAYQLWNDQYLE